MVIRINKTKDYTTMSNYHFREKEMSLKAKGLLSLMLSLPDDWDYSTNGLIRLSKDGKNSVMMALNELEQFGYLIRRQCVNKKGQFAGYDYDIYEMPKVENPYSENPYSDFPNTENHPQLNTNELNTNNNKKLNNYIKKEKTIKESQTDVLNTLKDEFEDVWTLYPRHQGKSEAFKHYVKARQSGVDKETIENGILNYRSYITKASLPIQYIKHGSSWFNQKGWENDYEYDTNNYTERRYKTQQERNREFLTMKMKEYQDEENRNS